MAGPLRPFSGGVITAEVHIPELGIRETFTFTITDGKVLPPKGCFVDQDGEKTVLGFGIKITLEKP
jgi:hypothetical protein